MRVSECRQSCNDAAQAPVAAALAPTSVTVISSSHLIMRPPM